MVGAILVRIPPADWTPAGYVPERQAGKMVTTRQVHVDVAIKTPQFYLLWVMLCLNVTAGIGILGKASDMLQDIFGASVAVSSGFVLILSVANMVGRFFWSTLSDYLGRKSTYGIYFGLGVLLYASLPALGQFGQLNLFVAACVLIMTMYGGGFATIPAY